MPQNDKNDKIVMTTKNFKYVHLTDYEKREEGSKSGRYDDGRVTHKIALMVDGAPRDKTEIDKEIAALKEAQKAKNLEYTNKFGRTYKTNLSTAVPTRMTVDSIMSRIFNTTFGGQMANTNNGGQMVKYEELNLHLDRGTGNTTAIIGSSKHGKTTALMYIANKYYSESINFLMAHCSGAPVYKSALPKYTIVTDKFDADVIAAQRGINKYRDAPADFTNFIDDFINLKHSMTMDDLILTLRNSNISTVISLQYVNTMSKSTRSSVNNALLFGQNTDEAAEQCVRVYLTSWMKKNNVPPAMMVPVFHAITADHGFFHVVPSIGKVSVCKLLV